MSERHPPYPQHARLESLNGENEVVGRFLEWLENHKTYCLGVWREREIKDWAGRLVEHEPYLVPAYVPIPHLLAEYYGIDYEALAQEKETMLAEIRAAGERRAR